MNGTFPPNNMHTRSPGAIAAGPRPRVMFSVEKRHLSSHAFDAACLKRIASPATLNSSNWPTSPIDSCLKYPPKSARCAASSLTWRPYHVFPAVSVQQRHLESIVMSGLHGEKSALRRLALEYLLRF